MNYKFEALFKSDKGTLIMNDSSDFKIIDINGIESSSYTINKSDSEDDGADVTSVKVNPRSITIKGDIEKNEYEDKNRDLIIRFFDPDAKGELFITRNNVQRKIQYNVSSFKFANNKMAEYMTFTISLECIENPFFEDAKNRASSLTSIVPQFAFPLGIVKSKGKVSGYIRFKDYMPIVNDGDRQTGLEIVVTAKRGIAENVKIILNNDLFIKVNTVLNQKDVLKINTNTRKKTVILNETNITNKIDRESTFFSLKKGKNLLSYECEKGSANIDIDVYFYRKYLGM